MEGKLFIGSDHAGFDLKEELVARLRKSVIDLDDVGTYSADSCDYPDFAAQVARNVSNGSGRGILVCGSGIGMSIVANKFKGVRAALCLDEDTARLARQHNDANVLVLAGRKTAPEAAEKIVQVFLATPFEGGRHGRRVDKIGELEERLRPA
ncbi:MAG: ribose 5-phosphate isomerase B [Smithellaceae bacterium]|nr:ribose 5-phosphate isomerase B [Smithellaceae bacterium]